MREIEISEIKALFTTQADIELQRYFADKPKIFMKLACRGNVSSTGITRGTALKTQSKRKLRNPNARAAPTYTTIEGEIQSISSDLVIFPDASVEILQYNWECVLEEEEPMFEYVFPRFAYRWRYIDNEYSCFSPFSEVAFLGNKFEYVSSDAYNIGMTNNVRKLIIEN